MDIAKANRATYALKSGRQFRENPQPQGYSVEVKVLCVKMSLNGMRFRGIERVTGINHNSVINWVRQAVAALQSGKL